MGNDGEVSILGGKEIQNVSLALSGGSHLD